MPPATNSGQAMQNLQSYTAGMQSPDQLMQSANNQFQVGQQQQQVGGLRQAVNNTENLLNQVAPSVMGRTANSLVTSAQADRQIANEQAPLNTQLNKENQDYNQANANLVQSQDQASQLANAEMTGQSQRQSYLQGIYNDLYTQEQNAAQLASNERIANTNAAASRASGGGGGSAASAKASLGQDIQNAFDNFDVRPPYYTENTILPTLIQAYPEIDPAAIQKQVYATRKLLGYG